MKPSQRGNSLKQVHYRDVEQDNVGRRLDNYLLAEFKNIPKSCVYRLIRSGQVRVNGGRVKPLHRLRTGDRIRIPPMSIAAPAKPLRVDEEDARRLSAAILFEDDDLLVLNKPSGVAAHGGSRCNWGLAEMFKSLRANDAIPLPAHRLDKQTSGCLVFAKRRPVLLELHRVFRELEVKKTYLALLVGSWDSSLFHVDAPIKVQHGRSGAQVCIDEDTGKSAVTEFEPLRMFGQWTLVKATPHSGRMHQIRIHAAHCRHPVAQDRRYGNFEANAELEKMGLRRLFLHAEALSFPYQGRERSFAAPLPQDLSGFLDRLN